MRSTLKEQIIGIQGETGGVTERPPEAQGRRGLWQGHPNNNGSFKRGHDPRRHMNGPIDGQRQKSIEALASEHAQLAVGALVDVLSDEDQPAMARVQAAEKLLDRGFGKAVDRSVQISLNDQDNKPTKLLTRDELLAKLSQRFTEEVTEGGEHASGITYESDT